MTLISKEETIKKLQEFAEELTSIGGSYVRCAIRVVVEPMQGVEKDEDDLK